MYDQKHVKIWFPKKGMSNGKTKKNLMKKKIENTKKKAEHDVKYLYRILAGQQ